MFFFNLKRPYVYRHLHTVYENGHTRDVQFGVFVNKHYLYGFFLVCPTVIVQYFMRRNLVKANKSNISNSRSPCEVNVVASVVHNDPLCTVYVMICQSTSDLSESVEGSWVARPPHSCCSVPVYCHNHRVEEARQREGRWRQDQR